MFSRRLLGIGCIVGLGLIVAVTYGAVVSAEHSWGSYHWARSSNPVELTLGDNFNKKDVWNGHLTTAVNDWNLSTTDNPPVLKLTEVAGETTPRKCKAANGKIEVCAERYGNTGWLGLAQIWISGDHITKAIAKMNDFYFDTVKYNSDPWRQFVMCQEVGHDFGLGHQSEDFTTAIGSCMDYTSDPESNQQPDPHDYEQLQIIYGHLDADDDGGSTKECKGPAWKCAGSQPPPPAFDMELPNSGQWGRAIAVSRDGGQSVFVQDFGGGYKVYTHVTWTLEVAETLAARR